MGWRGGGRYVSAGPFRGTHTLLHVARDSHESLQASVCEWTSGRLVGPRFGGREHNRMKTGSELYFFFLASH